MPKPRGQHSIKGKRFGRWVVLDKASKEGYLTCRCDCGTVRDVYAPSLKSGNSLSCGCLKGYLAWVKSDKEIGKKYGRLTVIKWMGGGKYVVECECGKRTIVNINSLRRGDSKSCGCLRAERNRAKYSEMLTEMLPQVVDSQVVDGTTINSLNQKISKNSKTGVKGVSRKKDGTYRAYINLRRRQYHLGEYKTLEEAAAARQAAEEEMYEPILKKHAEEFDKEAFEKKMKAIAKKYRTK